MDRKLGLIELTTYIKCEKELLGKKFKTSIAGIEAEITFPSYDLSKEGKVGLNHPLLPPAQFSKAKRGNEGLFWGFVRDYPNGISCVRMLAIDFYSNLHDELIANFVKESSD